LDAPSAPSATTLAPAPISYADGHPGPAVSSLSSHMSEWRPFPPQSSASVPSDRRLMGYLSYRPLCHCGGPSAPAQYALAILSQVASSPVMSRLTALSSALVPSDRRLMGYLSYRLLCHCGGPSAPAQYALAILSQVASSPVMSRLTALSCFNKVEKEQDSFAFYKFLLGSFVQESYTWL
jgi:hypothetical protein